MTETNTPPSGSRASVPRTVVRRFRAALPWFVGGVAFLVLGAAIAYVGLQPSPPVPPAPDLTPIANQIAGLANEIGQVKSGLGAMNGKLASVEQKLASLPAPQAAPSLAPITRQLGALEKRVAALAAAEAHSSKALAAHGSSRGPGLNADALKAALAPLNARLDTLEKAEAGAAKADAAHATEQATQQKNLAALEKSTAELTHSEQRLTDRLASLAHVVRVTAVAAALRDGQPLGPIPGAPPALARYASVAPPTLSSLRLAFPEAAHAQVSVRQSGSESQGFVDQVRARLGSLITVREGNKVIVGNPAAGVVAKAKDALGAGDLRGALDALGALSPPLAPAMTAWMADARNLLAAEAALTSLREQS